MNKVILSLGLALTLALASSAALADSRVPEHPCPKPAVNEGSEVARYESCMAEFIKSQKAEINNHQEALRRAEAAMEQPLEARGN